MSRLTTILFCFLFPDGGNVFSSDRETLLLIHEKYVPQRKNTKTGIQQGDMMLFLYYRNSGCEYVGMLKQPDTRSGPDRVRTNRLACAYVRTIASGLAE